MLYSVNMTRPLVQRGSPVLNRAFSTQTSLSEASEALQHVTEEENQKVVKEKPAVKNPPKLDREKVRSAVQCSVGMFLTIVMLVQNLNMTYSIAGVDKLEAVNKLLYASYHPDEPITRHLGLYKGLNSIPDADARVKATVLRNLSMSVTCQLSSGEKFLLITKYSSGLHTTSRGRLLEFVSTTATTSMTFYSCLSRSLIFISLSSLLCFIFPVLGRGHRPEVQALPRHPQSHQGEESARLR